MTEKNRISYHGGVLEFEARGKAGTMPGSIVTEIVRCRMADGINHGEEQFHVLLSADRMLLVGPFVHGGLGTIEAVRHDHPSIKVTDAALATIPYRFREPGLLGLRLFPIAGLVEAPRGAFSAFDFVTEEQTNE